MEQTKALTLPDEQQFKADLVAITRFQQTCQKLMLKGHDYGIIPGTTKPTLLKPGAEKITKILGLSDQYEVTQRIEKWDAGFFHYEVKCILSHLGSGVIISEGLGSCNSMESKYRYRWLWSSDLPADFDREKAVMRWVKLKSGSKSPQWRTDNEDIYSQVNTLLKMAEKRSLVDAALHAGRLSDLFTQDIEDMNIGSVEQEEKATEAKATGAPKEHWCKEHNCAFTKKQTYGKDHWSHMGPDGKWCNEAKKKETQPEPAAEASQEVTTEIKSSGNCPKCEAVIGTLNEQDSTCPNCGVTVHWQGSTPWVEEPEPAAEEAPHIPESTAELPSDEPEPAPKDGIDEIWLKESLAKLSAMEPKVWGESNLLSYMKITYNVEAKTVLEAAKQLDKGQRAHFEKRISESTKLE